jgi:hypothetical protein
MSFANVTFKFARDPRGRSHLLALLNHVDVVEAS